MKRELLILIFLISASIYSSAQIAFQKTYGGTNGDGGSSGQQTTDGGYILLGNTDGFGVSYTDIYLIKTDVNGDKSWTRTYGGTLNDFGYSVKQTTDGGYIIAGITGSFGQGGDDVYLIKTDGNGDTLWTKTFGGATGDQAYSVQQTTDGGYIIAGFGSLSSGSGAYIIKTHANGDKHWSKTFGSASGVASSIHQTTDGGYIMTGYTSNPGNYDIFLIKTDSNGDFLWMKTYGDASYDYGLSIQQTSDGGYIVAGQLREVGSSYSNVCLIKTNSNGDSLWTKTYGGSTDDGANSVQQTMDGGFIIAGFIGTSNPNFYLAKTDSTGNFAWTKTFGGIFYERGNYVQQTADGGYIIIGQTTSFGSGNSDVYLIKTDSNGNSGCNQANNTPTEFFPAIVVTSPLLIGSAANTFEKTPNTIQGSGGIATNLCAVGINEIKTSQSFFVSSNPNRGNFIISFQEPIKKGHIKISNLLAENVFTEDIFNESEKEINLKNISSGIYFLKVFDDEKYYCKKIIIARD